MSLFLIAEERGLVKKSRLTGRIIKLLEGLGLRLADLLITDTEAYLAYHCKTYGLKPKKFRLVPAGMDDRIFYPRPEITPTGDHFRVIYYGTFIPNHGVLSMVRAAELLKDQPEIRFIFYGDGPERRAAQDLATALGLGNTSFPGWIQKDKLPEEIARSHLCLGVFGTTEQSLMTIQNKIWECMAMGRPVISGDAPTIRQAIRDRDEIYLVARNDAEALAHGLIDLKDDPNLRRRIAQAGIVRAAKNNTLASGRRLKETLIRL
jgi:glycosyltransferase involved in cell wall biosynthesis